MIVKPSIGFVRTDSDAQFLTDAKTIISSMTGNAAYPSPSPTLAAIGSAVNEFDTALANAVNGGTQLTAIKNEKRAALAALLRQLASYVHVACKGNLPTLISSGFPYQKPTPTPAGELPAPVTPVLTLGVRSGVLNATTQRNANGYAYNWRIALASAPDTYLQQTQTTAASESFQGLTPGQIYSVDVNVLGSLGPSDWSDTAQQMVL